MLEKQTIVQDSSRLRVCVATCDEERREIYSFRYKVYVEELGKAYLKADHQKKEISSPLDEIGTQFYVLHENKIVACHRVDWGNDVGVVDAYRDMFSLDLFREFPPSALVFSSRFIIAPEWRKTSLSLSLLTIAYTLGRQKAGVFSFCHCVPPLAHFYERLGFRRYKNPFEDLDAGVQIPMLLIADDVEHLAAVQSPFLQSALQWPNSVDNRRWYESHLSEVNFESNLARQGL